MPELKYSDFSAQLVGRGANRNLPLAGGIELTARCNLRCVHCYVNLPLSAEGDLPTPIIERILGEMADAGCLWLLITGGEPLVREDFTRLYTLAKNKGFLVTLFTNATLLTPDHARLLEELRPFKVEVTLYGATEETYERVTRVRGSYRRCMEGIERLAATKVPLCLKTMAMTLNAHEVFGVEELANRYGATFRFDPMIMGRLDGQEGPRRVRMSPAQALEVDLSDPRRVQEWVKARDKFYGPPKDDGLLFQCGAGLNNFYVDAQGGLLLCPVTRSWRYDLVAGGFGEGWQKAMSARRQRRRTRPSPCSDCHLVSLCGQCPGWGETEHGDPEARVEHLCRVAHLRAEFLEKIAPQRRPTRPGDEAPRTEGPPLRAHAATPKGG